jgi:2-dehydro-3-deoxyglucarate aldolase/4-hydroxy-2-oxoheptanedioate aldolase
MNEFSVTDAPELKVRLRNGDRIGVFWLALGSTALAELAGGKQPDAIVIDMQHGLWNRDTLEGAVGLATRPVLVRVSENSPRAIGEALDAGAEGVLVPMVETADQAARAAAAAHYPPHGSRSAGGCRPLAQGFDEYRRVAHNRVIVGVMIETARGLAHASEIARTPNIDLVLIGVGDLALAFADLPDQQQRFQQACDEILAVCRCADLPCGIFTLDEREAVSRRKEGYALTVVANDISVVALGFGAAMNRFAQP